MDYDPKKEPLYTRTGTVGNMSQKAGFLKPIYSHLTLSILSPADKKTASVSSLRLTKLALRPHVKLRKLVAGYLHNRRSRLISLLALSILTLPTVNGFAEEEATKQIESSFARDVLMPVGMPVLTTYHNIRDNIFLNTKVKDATFIESIGNFFLTPSRYLFDGRTIKIEDENSFDFQDYPSFHYEKMHWFKAILSTIALPVSEVLGATFKGLSYLSPEVRRRHRKLKRAYRSTLVKSNLEKFTEAGIDAFHCDEYIPCQGHKRPSNLLKRQKIEIEALKEIAEMLDSHNIIWWIDCGTCLGAYRYGGIIPWDWDIDISILIPDHENVKKLLKNLDRNKYHIQDWSSYTKPRSFLKLYVKETKNFIDIYHYKIDEKERMLAYLFTYLDSPFPESWKTAELKCMKPLRYDEIFPLKKAKFDGLTVWAPNQVVNFLQSKYGENLDPAKVWDESTKTYLKVEGHPYYDE